MGKGAIYYRIGGLQLAVGSWRWAVCSGQFAGDGVLAIYENGTQLEVPIYGASRLGMYNKASGTSVYQLTDHLGNVRAVIAKNGSEAVAATSTTDYYPFGMPMPNRQIINGQPYRYAYQGQEKDPETGKEAFQLRLWDARIGRWLTTDPKKEFSSPYLGMGNNPIRKIDPDGGSTEEPPVDGLAYFKDDTGEYFWNVEKGSYEHYTVNNDGFSFFEGYFNSDMTSRPVGNYSLYFEPGGGMNVTEEFNRKHTIEDLAVGFMVYFDMKGPVKDLSDQSRYPGVKIYSSEYMNGAITLGNVIFTNPRMEGRATLNHEYGHFLDFKYHFNYNQEAYLKEIGVPSVLSTIKATFDSNFNHHSSNSEIRADILGGAYHNYNLYTPKK